MAAYLEFPKAHFVRRDRSLRLMREPAMTKYFKAALLSAIPVASAAIAAYAADPTPPQTQTRPQVATDPGSAYSSTQMPGPKGGGSIWIPSKPSAGFGRTEEGEFYAKKGFGPPTR